MRLRQVFFGLAATLLFGAPAVPAASWIVDSERSEIGFEYLRAGVAATGRFERFEGSGTFDPANPGAATLRLSIDSTSIDLFDDLASAFATSAEWFDSRNHRYVVYELATLEPIGGNRYRSAGTLTLRGRSLPIDAEIELEIRDDGALAIGVLDILRSDYLLGVGPSAAFVTIGPSVSVSFRLRARQVR